MRDVDPDIDVADADLAILQSFHEAMDACHCRCGRLDGRRIVTLQYDAATAGIGDDRKEGVVVSRRAGGQRQGVTAFSCLSESRFHVSESDGHFAVGRDADRLQHAARISKQFSGDLRAAIVAPAGFVIEGRDAPELPGRPLGVGSEFDIQCGGRLGGPRAVRHEKRNRGERIDRDSEERRVCHATIQSVMFRSAFQMGARGEPVVPLAFAGRYCRIFERKRSLRGAFLRCPAWGFTPTARKPSALVTSRNAIESGLW